MSKEIRHCLHHSEAAPSEQPPPISAVNISGKSHNTEGNRSPLLLSHLVSVFLRRLEYHSLVL